jgi:hypothetical protein
MNRLLIFILLFCSLPGNAKIYFSAVGFCKDTITTVDTIVDSLQTDTIVHTRAIDSQMVCVDDTCYWDFNLAYDTSIYSNEKYRTHCLFKGCIQFTVFEENNDSCDISVHVYPQLDGLCDENTSRFIVDSMWGDITTQPAANRIIEFTFVDSGQTCLWPAFYVTGRPLSSPIKYSPEWYANSYSSEWIYLSHELPISIFPYQNKTKFNQIKPSIAIIISGNNIVIRSHELTGQCNLSIFNLTGRQLVSMPFIGGGTISLKNSLTAGTYIFSIEKGNIAIVNKIVAKQ